MTVAGDTDIGMDMDIDVGVDVDLIPAVAVAERTTSSPKRLNKIVVLAPSCC